MQGRDFSNVVINAFLLGVRKLVNQRSHAKGMAKGTLVVHHPWLL